MKPFSIRPKVLMIVGLLGIALIAFGAVRGRDAWLGHQLERVSKDWRQLQTAFACYGVDRCGIYYPPDTAWRQRTDPSFPLTFECDVQLITEAPVSWRGEPVTHWHPLTTPVAYAVSLPSDPFGKGGYGYMCWNYHDKTCVVALLLSPGPDHRYEESPEALRETLNGWFRRRGNSSNLELEDRMFLRETLSPRIYDPTNGLRSTGDLIRLLTFGSAENSLYGWGTNTWADLPAADLSFLQAATRAPDSALDFDTYSGAPLPQPSSMAERMSHRRQIPLPLAHRFITHPGHLLETKGQVTSLRHELIVPLYNHLGRDFMGVFDAPRPLAPEEIEALETWRGEAPEWWETMQEVRLADWRGDKIFLPVDQAFVLLPLLGKSQLLLVAESAARARRGEAAERLYQLRKFVGMLRHDLSAEPDPFELQVLSALECLCVEFQKILDMQENDIPSVTMQ